MNGNTLFPRVVNSRSTGFKIRHISGDYGQIMLEGSGSEQQILGRQSGLGNKSSPAVGDIGGNHENVVRKQDELLAKPFLDRNGLSQIPQPRIFNSTADLSNGNDAQRALHGIVSQPPSKNASVCAMLFPQLGDKISIQQIVHQSSASRRFHSRRLFPNSKSGAILPNSKMASNRFRGFSTTSVEAAGASLSASLKIRRCSSSAETPCSAARRFKDFANSSGIFLTSNCAMSYKVLSMLSPVNSFSYAQ